MNERHENGDAQEDAGDRLARHVATGIASLIGIAIVAAGSVIYTNSVAIARLAEKCESGTAKLFELHDRISQYPSAADIAGCRQRVEVIERYIELDKHRIGKLEDAVKDLERKPSSRADPFTGSEGRELERRIKQLETQQ